MDSLTVAAASGMRSRMDSLELLANNLANAGTSGYKSDSEFYGLYTSAEAADTDGDYLSALPVIQRQWTDYSQGTLQPTGNPLDVALSGRGFLAVNGPGGTLYTRNGSLKISSAGVLVSAEGFPLRAKGNTTVRVNSGNPIEIATDGTVRQDGQTLGELEVVDFKSTESLKKMSGTSFQNTDPKNLPVAAANTEVQQARLENSNVAVPEAAMRLVSVMRQFEMLQKAVMLNADLGRKAIEDVARVSG